jgi:hypothetical protein
VLNNIIEVLKTTTLTKMSDFWEMWPIKTYLRVVTKRGGQRLWYDIFFPRTFINLAAVYSILAIN